MHGYAKRGLALVAAASGLILGSAAAASADASVNGHADRSGGVVAGNVVSAPVDVPVNFCGNQAVAAALRTTDVWPTCAVGSADATVDAGTYKSGGVLSGNVVSAPVNVPVNVCGNQVAVLALLNWVGGATCTIG
jgi:hypothetical protein